MIRLTIPALLIGMAAAAPAVAQEAPRTLTLEQAIAIAKEGNRPLKAVRQKVEQMRQTSSLVFSNFLPRLQTTANYMGSSNTGGIMLPRGSLGNLPELGGAFPPADLNISQGGQAFFFTYTTLSQPITHFFKIREGVRVARADEVAASANLAKAEQEVAYGVMRAYGGVLIAEQSLEVARVRVTATEQRIAYTKVAVQSGTAIEVAERDARVKWLQARQEVLERQGEVDDLTYALTDALGMPPRTPVKLVMPQVPDTRMGQMEEYVRTALESNPDVLEAKALVTKATHGVNAARADYIPEIGVQGMHFFQNSVPFFPKNTLGFGIQGKFTILDFGARKSTIQSRRAQLAQAEYNLTMVEGRVRGEVEGAYRKALRAKDIVELAREGAALRTEAARLRINQTTAGLAMAVQEREATADRMEGALDLVKAELGYLIALAELQKAAGTLART